MAKFEDIYLWHDFEIYDSILRYIDEDDNTFHYASLKNTNNVVMFVILVSKYVHHYSSYYTHLQKTCIEC